MDYIIGNSEVLEFRDGIFALRTRRFGTVAEIMIKKLYDFEESGSLAFDKKDIKTNERIEVKFSTVLKENDDTIRGDNVISQVIKANLANRAMNSKDAEIYKMDSKEVLSCPGYSDKQHRGNEGEGQFHLNQDNIDYHRKNHQVMTINYQELYDLFSK